MKWYIYYTAMVILNFLSLILFHKSIHVEYLSLIPLCLLGNSIFQAYYHAHRKAQEPNTTYSAKSNITEREWEQVVRYTVYSYLIVIPLYLPFVFFFSWEKILSLILFATSFLGGSVWFRIRHGKEWKERCALEKNELSEQQKKEEMGQWK